MKLAWKKLLACLCAIFCIMGTMYHTSDNRVYAAVSNLTVGVSSDSLEVGDWLYVTLRFESSEQLAGVFAQITYDPGILEYTGGAAEGDTGSLTLRAMESEASTVLEYTLSFVARAEGDTSIRVVESSMYNGQAESVGTPTGSKDVHVNPAGTMSSDATLKSLMVSYGMLSPSFSPSITEYTLSVPNNITTVTLSAIANDATAAVQVSGVSDLAVGDNIRPITVIAPDGTSIVYTVTITRAAAEESSTNSSIEDSSTGSNSSADSSASNDLISFKIDGITMYMQSIPQGTSIPSGFSRGSYVLSGQSMDVAQSPDGTVLFYLTDFRGENGAFYLYDPQTQTCLNSVSLYINGETHLVLDASMGSKIPQGTSLQAVTIHGRSIQAFVSPSNAQEYIVYVQNSSGTRDYFYYNVSNDTLRSYTGEFEGELSANDSVQDSSAGSLISSSDSSSSGGTTQFLSGFVRYIPYILIGLVLFMLLLIVLIILLARTYHRRKAQDDEPEYSQTAQLEPLDDTLSTPADPEDIQLDSNAFAQWKEATQKIPVMKMTEVHTTTIQEVTGILPDLDFYQEPQSPTPESQEAPTAEPVPAEPEAESEKDAKKEDDYETLSPDDFFI